MDKKTHFQHLKGKLETRNKSLKEKLAYKHREALEWAINNTRQLAAGAMGSVMLLSSPTLNLLPSQTSTVNHEQFINVPDNLFVVNDITPYLPEDIDNFVPQQEEKVAEILSGYYGFTVKPEINGMRLKNTYGYIGAEQHLMRYPGDSVSNMAPGRGAYGYFAPSRNELTPKAIDQEKYYIAVQTFLADGYAAKTRDYVNFFKFRKMLVVNPNSGKAIVVIIGDSGPAVWTKKQLGGSPEVMQHLGRVDGKAKGKVLYFFIEDPDDQVPLGPIEPKQS